MIKLSLCPTTTNYWLTLPPCSLGNNDYKYSKSPSKPASPSYRGRLNRLCIQRCHWYEKHDDDEDSAFDITALQPQPALYRFQPLQSTSDGLRTAAERTICWHSVSYGQSPSAGSIEPPSLSRRFCYWRWYAVRSVKVKASAGSVPAQLKPTSAKRENKRTSRRSWRRIAYPRDRWLFADVSDDEQGPTCPRSKSQLCYISCAVYIPIQ